MHDFAFSTVVFTKKNPLYNLIYFCLLILDSHENCETCLDVLQALENIDDDADRQNIALFKTTDAKFAEDIGISEFPSLGKGSFKNYFDKMWWVSRQVPQSVNSCQRKEL